MKMATRSEQVHAEEQRHATKKSKKKSAEHATKKARTKRKLAAHENVHAGKKATYALESRSAKGKASRKSSRKSANRSKFDAPSEVRGERNHATPEARYRNRK
jgi:hypothetical protein